MSLLIQNGRVVDPANSVDAVQDVLDRRRPDRARSGAALAAPPDATVLDATGKVVCPGFIDIHVHLREPGYEYKETVATRHPGGRRRRLHRRLLHGQHPAGERQPLDHRLHPRQGGDRGRRARLPDRRRHARARRQGAGRAGRAGRGRLRGVLRRRQLRDERRALPPGHGVHAALRRAGHQPRRGPRPLARHRHERGRRLHRARHPGRAGGGRGRHGGARHPAGRADRRPRAHRPPVDGRARCGWCATPRRAACGSPPR